MQLFPQCKRISSPQELVRFSQTYADCSGLPVPEKYLKAHPVFAIYWRQEMIGGFILADGPQFRTIELFADPSYQAPLYRRMEDPLQFTELCCFWIARAFRTRTFFNLYIWLCLALALKWYAKTYILFGTNSRRLAELYRGTRHSVLIHKDQVRGKSTYIFQGNHRICLTGISQIVLKKLRRVLGVFCRRRRLRVA